MIAIKCPYCESLFVDNSGKNFQDNENYTVIECNVCDRHASLKTIYHKGERPEEDSCDDEYGDYDYNYNSDGMLVDYKAIKADCLNYPKDKNNHLFGDSEFCLICCKDVKPQCKKENGKHEYDDITHICIHCNKQKDPNFIPCHDGGNLHVFENHLCYCLKKDNFSESDKLNSESQCVNIKKAIGSLGELLDYKSIEYKEATTILFSQLSKIDKFLDANR